MKTLGFCSDNNRFMEFSGSSIFRNEIKYCSKFTQKLKWMQKRCKKYNNKAKSAFSFSIFAPAHIIFSNELAEEEKKEKRKTERKGSQQQQQHMRMVRFPLDCHIAFLCRVWRKTSRTHSQQPLYIQSRNQWQHPYHGHVRFWYSLRIEAHPIPTHWWAIQHNQGMLLHVHAEYRNIDGSIRANVKQEDDSFNQRSKHLPS